MTLTPLEDLLLCSSRPLSPTSLKPPSPPLISVDAESPDVPSYHATNQATVLFLLTLLELAPPHLHRYIDPPQSPPQLPDGEGTQMDLESLLYLCKDVTVAICPQLLDTEEWDRLVQRVLLLRDTDDEDSDSDFDSYIPVFQDQWEKQWEYSDEDDEPIQDVDDVVLEGRGRQRAHRPWEAYGLDDGEVISDEFDDVEKDGDGDPATMKEWHSTSDSIGCMDLVSRMSKMLAEWVRENGEPCTIAPSFEHLKSSLQVLHGPASKDHPSNCKGIHKLRRLPVGCKAIDSAFSSWAIQYVEPDFDLPDLPPYPPTKILVSDWTWMEDLEPSRGRKRR